MASLYRKANWAIDTCLVETDVSVEIERYSIGVAKTKTATSACFAMSSAAGRR